MYVFENPVLQRELLVNLRMTRAFVLLFLYQALLAAVIYLAWPQDERLDLSVDADSARTLVDMFFLGQYLLASMMAPSFAAGTITGEKERLTYEMLLASPLRPSAIVFGKMVASLAHLAVLIFSSLPIVMLCLPLGGVHLQELLAAYLGLFVSVITFGAISVACSAFFKRTAASLVVSYLLILPLAITGALVWYGLSDFGEFRLLLTVIVMPSAGAALCFLLFFSTSARLLHPPDVGSEGKEVVDLDQEAQQAVGLVIQSDQFPDKLFAPAKRDDLMADGANPVYDKEIRSEIFSQGTLMLRLVIQVSMLLAIPLMAACLYIMPQYAPWYIAYVVMFNMLVGPVFSAGSVTSERERQTLDLLLTTLITPWQILWGKLIAGLRVSSVLTTFLLWPVLLASVMVTSYWSNLGAVAAYLGIVLVTCLNTAMLALFCSVVFHKSATSLMTTYALIIFLFCAPLALNFFMNSFFPDQYAGQPDTISKIEQFTAQGKSDEEIADELVRLGVINARVQSDRWRADDVQSARVRAKIHHWVPWTGAVSPFVAAFETPLDVDIYDEQESDVPQGSWGSVAAFLLSSLGMDLALLGAMMWLFQRRWRVAG
jgi:ABC-type transport system involved in multi-copper enzyme maturation permease subunit